MTTAATVTRLRYRTASYDLLRSECRQSNAATDAVRPALHRATMLDGRGNYLTTLTLHHTPDHPQGHEYTYVWYDQGAGDFDAHHTSGASAAQALYRIRHVDHGEARVYIDDE